MTGRMGGMVKLVAKSLGGGVVVGAMVLAGLGGVAKGAEMGAAEFGATAEQPVGWRGDGSGIYPGANGPVEWEMSEAGVGKNIAWRTQLPMFAGGSGAAQPIVVKNRVYLTVNPKDATRAPDDLFCFDLATGKLLWIRALTSYDAAPEEHRKQVKDAVTPLLAELETLNGQLIETLNAGKLNQDDWRNNVEGKRVGVASKINDALIGVDSELYKNGGRHDWGYGSATPTSDGAHIFVYFSNRLAACVDLDGKPVWATMYPKKLGATGEHGSHGSPLLLPDRVVICYAESLFALDKGTGKVLWDAKPEGAWGLCSSSLAAAKLADGYLILMATTQGFRADTGQSLWGKMPGYQGENTTPVVGGSTVVTYERSGIRTFRLPESLGGKLAPAGSMIYKDIFKEYQIGSPLFCEGLVYALSDKGLLHVFDPAANGGKGAMVYEQQLELSVTKTPWVGNPGISPSPAIAGKRLYVLDNTGAALVLAPGREYKQLARNRLAVKDVFVVSPVFVGKQMLIRGQAGLYCVGEK